MVVAADCSEIRHTGCRGERDLTPPQPQPPRLRGAPAAGGLPPEIGDFRAASVRGRAENRTFSSRRALRDAPLTATPATSRAVARARRTSDSRRADVRDRRDGAALTAGVVRYPRKTLVRPAVAVLWRCGAVAVLCGMVAVLCGAVAVLCGSVAVLCGVGLNGAAGSIRLRLSRRCCPTQRDLRQTQKTRRTEARRNLPPTASRGARIRHETAASSRFVVETVGGPASRRPAHEPPSRPRARRSRTSA